MYGDFLVPENTNVNNAITTGTGAKWELFFEETRDTSGAVGYDWDKDVDNTPLNLKGILILVRQDTVVSITNHALSINGLPDLLLQNNASSNPNLITCIKSQITNGLLETFGKLRNKENTASSGQWQCGTSNQLVNNIHSFNYSITNVPSGTNIRIYVLRGV